MGQNFTRFSFHQTHPLILWGIAPFVTAHATLCYPVKLSKYVNCRLAASCELQTCCKLWTAGLLQIVNCRLAANCELQACCKLSTADLQQVVNCRLAASCQLHIKQNHLKTQEINTLFYFISLIKLLRHLSFIM